MIYDPIADDQRDNKWFAEELLHKCEHAEAYGTNWLHGVSDPDSGYPAEIILTTTDARIIAHRLSLGTK